MEPTATYEEAEALDLRYYAQLARRNLAILVTVPLLFGVLAFLNSNRATRMYAATSLVLLRPNDPNERLGSSNVSQTNTNIGEQYARSQANLARGPEVRDAAADATGLEATAIDIAIKVTALVDSNTLEITATTDEELESKEIADAVAEAYIANRREYARSGLERAIVDIEDKLVGVEEQLRTLSDNSGSARVQAELDAAKSQYDELTARLTELGIDLELKNGEAELIARAELPEAPVSPKPMRSGVLGFMLGGLLAAGVVLLRDRFDTRLRSREEAEAVTGLMSIGEVPFDKTTERLDTGIAVVRDPDGPYAESIRSLRVSLKFLSLEDPLQVILLTSATPADGKSTTAANLAASYAMAGQRTLLVSGDLRRPQAEKLVGTTPGPGFVELLTDIASKFEERHAPSRNGSSPAAVTSESTTSGRTATAKTTAARTTATATARSRKTAEAGNTWISEWCHADEENLWVLPAGRAVANPVEILGSLATRRFFELAREQFDTVIVDSPPLLAVADAAVMSPYVDGVVLVCSHSKTSRTHLQRAGQALLASRARVLGLVVNRVPRNKSEGGYYNYGYYGARPQDDVQID